MRRSLEDLIGKKGTTTSEGIKQEVLFPKAGIYKILGIKIPVYSPLPKFTRLNRGSIDSRIENYYGKVDIIKNKVYKKKYE